MTNKIVTNLRVDKHEWQQIKSMAAELNISVNEYINQLIREQTLKKSLVPHSHKQSLINSDKKYSIWRPWEIAEDIKDAPMDIKEEDEIIYGV